MQHFFLVFQVTGTRHSFSYPASLFAALCVIWLRILSHLPVVNSISPHISVKSLKGKTKRNWKAQGISLGSVSDFVSIGILNLYLLQLFLASTESLY